MNRATVRTAAAIFAAAVTISGLKGIAVLAEADSSARRAVVVLPQVVVSATPREPAPQFAAGNSSPAVVAASVSPPASGVAR